MSWTRRDRPLWVRGANALGRALAGLGPTPIPRLDEASLLEQASRRTGLGDFGDAGFREPLGLFVAALEEEAELTPVGRALARHELLGLLGNRLEIEETYRREPEIADQALAPPIFVTGTGRSGTSILHELLAQDPAHRVLLSWEALHPCPPPRSESYASDPRIRRAEREVRLWERIAPRYRSMHENGARVPQECIYLTAHCFVSDLLSGMYAVPSYAAWLARADLRAAYRIHRRLLLLLQWRHRGERWVLKAPSHLWALESLLAVYPDARIVQTHRDPLAVIASMTSLMATLRWMRSDRVDPVALGERTLRSVGYMLEQSLRVRDAGRLPPEQVCDVRYADFLADPIASVAAVYDHLGLSLGAEAESRMRAYLAAKPKDRHGAHAWRLTDTGLDVDAARERFAAYRERFGVPAEV
jgi:hypothetical protein